LIEAEFSKSQAASQSEYGWEAYSSLNDTHKWMESMTQKYPEIASIINVGSSYENRSILGVKLEFGKVF
jgi:hypothetical protein